MALMPVNFKTTFAQRIDKYPGYIPSDEVDQIAFELFREMRKNAHAELINNSLTVPKIRIYGDDKGIKYVIAFLEDYAFSYNSDEKFEYADPAFPQNLYERVETCSVNVK
jgi:hypothetical protein